MTVAPQLAIGTTLANTDDTSFSVFQLINNPGATQLVAGNIFMGLQGYVAVRIAMGELLGLARGAKIETGLTDAALTFVADGSWTAGGELLVNCMVDDSPRGASEDGLGEAGPFDPRLAAKSPNGYGPAWRQDGWGVFDQRLEDTGATPFIDTGTATGGSFGIRTVTNHREQLAHQFTVPAGPGWSVARALLRLRRFGTPGGSMEVAIQANQVNSISGYNEPDGVDLGVSAAVLNSVAPLNPGIGQVTYAFTPDVVLAPGDYWTILRPAVAYAVSLTDFIVWGQRRIFFGIGGAHRTLLDSRFGLGNYPGHVDVSRDLAAKQVGADVVWNPIARSPGQTIATPDLSALVSEVVKTSGHETISALIFTVRAVGQTRTYRFAANGHPTRNPPAFSCRFTRRNTRAEAT